MGDKEWYKDWFNSPFYHRLYFKRDQHEATDFLNTLLRHLQPAPNSCMLDVACGKGRYSLLLAEHGYDVTGIDIAADSIAKARESERENLHFYQHDMRLPAWINYFDYAFNFFTSFGYFATRREHEDAIRTVATALKRGGLFVIDYLNVHYVEERLVHNEEKTMDDVRFEIHRWMDQDHFFKKIIVHAPESPAACQFTEKVAKFSLGDFTDMLSYFDLQIQEVFGDYQLSPYHVRNTPRMIIMARKK